ncbi:hypothetical protein MNBD_GAMMA01-274 [hydrothermal vent metagenome]|uniref:HPt domain-containing protein n=1 Tax=hydrothermal vent metagenome TaxID=652676 RepID=A0A3B0VKW8_9ZZZZ
MMLGFAHSPQPTNTDLKAAWDNKDIPEIHSLLHKLSGSSGGYGFNDLYTLCQQAITLTAKNTDIKLEQLEAFLQKIYVELQL